mmetsp:Transcript_9421/g.26884  ORF Transcript_9421/g.26884 Transcript_9421/m.26884 type:complete len:239 (+) Transcript_9421:158-874(+)
MSEMRTMMCWWILSMTFVSWCHHSATAGFSTFLAFRMRFSTNSNACKSLLSSTGCSPSLSIETMPRPPPTIVLASVAEPSNTFRAPMTSANFRTTAARRNVSGRTRCPETNARSRPNCSAMSCNNFSRIVGDEGSGSPVGDRNLHKRWSMESMNVQMRTEYALKVSSMSSPMSSISSRCTILSLHCCRNVTKSFLAAHRAELKETQPGCGVRSSAFNTLSTCSDASSNRSLEYFVCQW